VRNSEGLHGRIAGTELAFVMGDDIKNVSADEAWSRVSRYPALLDVSVRGGRDCLNGKSHGSFTVVSPHVTTPDGIGNPLPTSTLYLVFNGETDTRRTPMAWLTPPSTSSST